MPTLQDLLNPAIGGSIADVIKTMGSAQNPQYGVPANANYFSPEMLDALYPYSTGANLERERIAAQQQIAAAASAAQLAAAKIGASAQVQASAADAAARAAAARIAAQGGVDVARIGAAGGVDIARIGQMSQLQQLVPNLAFEMAKAAGSGKLYDKFATMGFLGGAGMQPSLNTGADFAQAIMSYINMVPQATLSAAGGGGGFGGVPGRPEASGAPGGGNRAAKAVAQKAAALKLWQELGSAQTGGWGPRLTTSTGGNTAAGNFYDYGIAGEIASANPNSPEAAYFASKSMEGIPYFAPGGGGYVRPSPYGDDSVKTDVNTGRRLARGTPGAGKAYFVGDGAGIIPGITEILRERPGKKSEVIPISGRMQFGSTAGREAYPSYFPKPTYRRTASQSPAVAPRRAASQSPPVAPSPPQTLVPTPPPPPAPIAAQAPPLTPAPNLVSGASGGTAFPTVTQFADTPLAQILAGLRGPQPAFGPLAGSSQVGIPWLGIKPFDLPYRAARNFQRSDPYTRMDMMDLWKAAGIPYEVSAYGVNQATPGYRQYQRPAMTYN